MIVQHDGWWWPQSDSKARPVILRDRDVSIDRMLMHTRGRDLIVQAGGNIGVYPIALADHFQRVVTAEPDPVNAECLKRNIEARDSLKRVETHEAAFGQHETACGVVEVERFNCGAHRVSVGNGPLKMVTIDSLSLPACDAIWLDIEGAELLALRGAVETIAKFSPVIACEEKGLGAPYGVRDGDIARFLGFYGYEQIDQIGRDKVFKRFNHV